MPRNLPPLSALRAFDSAARHLSFKRAAEELHVTPAAISQQIKSLEEFAGTPLFHRLTRALALTEAGRQALPVLTEAFDRLEQAYALMRTGGRARPLTVSVPPSFASKWLVPRLGRFQEAAPDVEIRIDATTRMVDFHRDDIDVALRYGRGGYADLTCEKLFDSRVMPVCSPALLNGPIPLAEPSDLKNHTLLQFQETGAAAMEDTWDLWMKAAGIDGVDSTRGPRFNTFGLLIDAALAGQGVGLVEFVFAEQELARGTLVQPFCHLPKVFDNFGYHIVFPPHHAGDPHLQAFCDWVRRERDRTLAEPQAAR